MSRGKALIREVQIYRHFVLFLILSGRRMTYYKRRTLAADGEKFDNEKQNWMKGHVRNLFTISLSFWNQRVLQRNQSRHKCHSLERAHKEQARGNAPLLSLVCLKWDDGDVELPGRREECVSVLMFISLCGCDPENDAICSKFIWFGINLLHSYLMRIKVFCLERRIRSRYFVNMMTQTEWLEGRREPYWCFLIRLSNASS